MKRIESVDAFRGFVMLLMMGEVLNISAVSNALPESTFWKILAFNQNHVPWQWLSLHDMIQPAFSFLVGVVVLYSIASRKSKGATFKSLIAHTIKRSLILIFLGIFLRSMHSEQTNFTFEDTLTQIGLGYTFLVILAFCSSKVQYVSIAVILIGYWLLFALYPLPASNFDYASVGVDPNWPYNMDGFSAHWNKNTNAAWAFDTWFLNLFPREHIFLYNQGGYSTLSFIPTLATMILGLFAGKILRSDLASLKKATQFIYIGISLCLIAVIFHFTGMNPIVKRIWTPAWTLFSGGICFFLLAGFYWVIDVKGWKNWSFFLKVVGINSIAAYVIADGGIKTFFEKSLYIHLGPNFDQIFGSPYVTLVSGTIVLLLEWWLLYVLYKRNIFIKI